METGDIAAESTGAAAESETKPVEIPKAAESATKPAPSKKSLKRLAKGEKWQKSKILRRMAEREKAKLKRQQMREQELPLPVSRKQLKRKRVDYEASQCRVAIDLSFDSLMTFKEMSKCSKQLLRCYTLNRRANVALPLYLNSLNNSGPFYEIFSKHDGFENWDVKITADSYLDSFPKDKIVYLSSDSDNLLEKLEPDEVYVIGGLVDHNRHKGFCHQRAESAGVRHARLPLPENIILKTRTVLTIEQVFNILLQVHNGASWEGALLNVIPKRKGAVSKKIVAKIEQSEPISPTPPSSDDDNESSTDAKQELKLTNDIVLDDVPSNTTDCSAEG